MASSNSAQNEDKKLEDIFNEGFKLFRKIEAGNVPFNSDEFQNDVKTASRLFEDSTRLVSSIGMFSTNEFIEEIPTEHLKYLLLPYFLGQLSTKRQSYDRTDALEMAKVYYNDFLKRCEEYGILKNSRNNDNNQTEEENSNKKAGAGGRSTVADLLQTARKRNAKIEMYRRKKELEEQIEQMKIAMENPQADDDIKRDFHLKLIDHSIIGATEELQSIEQELEILSFRTQLKLGGDSEKQTQARNVARPPPRGTLKPIIITKDAAQKAVFGLGYPSLPVMSVNEFYDQRVKEGIFPNEKQVAEMNKKMMNPEDPEEKEEQEKVEKEALVENDDPAYLERQRQFDEYKDNVRRGAGNRYNRS